MPRVELIYDTDCPNLAEARKVLLSAFAQAGLPPSWVEWDRQSPQSPGYARRFGSPTILVEGRDIAGLQPAENANCCRLYEHGPDTLKGTPSVSQVASSLKNPTSNPEESSTMTAKTAKRKIEIFSAGCPACQQTIEMVRRAACPSCEVTVLDMNQPAVARRAKRLAIRSVPAVVVDGRLAGCCAGGGPDEATLRAAGLGRAIP